MLGSCEKCGRFTWVDRHHIVPKATGLNIDDRSYLCPTCHREYHQELGYKNLKNKSADFHMKKFFQWLILCVAIIFIVTHL